MDEYGQVGPDKPGYFEDVPAIARKLVRQNVVDVYFSARGTTKHVVLALLPTRLEEVVADEPISFSRRPDGFWDQPGIFVGVDGGNAGWLPARGDLDHGYVRGYVGSSFGIDQDGNDALSAFVNQVCQVIYGAAIAGEAIP